LPVDGICLQRLDTALAGDEEHQGLVVVDDASGDVRGLLVYGEVAGAADVFKVHLLAGLAVTEFVELLDAMTRVRDVARWRMLVCEMGEDADGGTAGEALRLCAFSKEACIPDLFAPGVALNVLVRRR